VNSPKQYVLWPVSKGFRPLPCRVDCGGSAENFVFLSAKLRYFGRRYRYFDSIGWMNHPAAPHTERRTWGPVGAHSNKSETYQAAIKPGRNISAPQGESPWQPHKRLYST
jgi:hypothetical protein